MREAIGRGGELVDAAQAERRRDYTCPHCGGRVFLRAGKVYERAFAHYQDEGIGCEAYFDTSADGTHAAEGDDGDEDRVSVLLRVVESAWSVLLAVDEMTAEDASATTLAELRLAELSVRAGSEEVLRLSALSVRHGVRRVAVEVPPSHEGYSVTFVGAWPQLQFAAREVEVSGLASRGTLFRVASAEAIRLVAGARVAWGQTLFLLAAGVSRPPQGCIAESFDAVMRDDHIWSLWRVALPSAPSAAVESWLASLGHAVSEPAWKLSLASVPRGYSSYGVAQLYLGEPMLAAVDKPAGSSATHLVFETGTSRAEVMLTDDPRTFSITRSQQGHGVLRVDGYDEARLEVEIVARPTVDELRRDVDRLPNLTVRLGERALAMADTALRKRERRALLTIQAGVAGARVTLMMRTPSRRRVLVSITTGEAERALNEAFKDDDVLEFQIDAGALGRCQISFIADAPAALAPSALRQARWISCAIWAQKMRAKHLPSWVARAAKETPQIRSFPGATRMTNPILTALVRKHWGANK